MRHRNNIKNMDQLLNYLLKRDLITADTFEILQHSTNCTKELFKRQCTNKSGPTVYSQTIRSFAFTLYFLAPKAYDYIRKGFDFELPHEDAITRGHMYIWTNDSIDGAPGFTKEAFTALRSATAITQHIIICSLTIGEMSIKRQTEFDNNFTNLYGYVNIGNDLMYDIAEEATEVMVFMLVAVRTSWKLPVAYFLTTGLNGHQKSILVKECLRKVEETGIRICSISFEGNSSNIAMARNLGCVFEFPNIKPWFLFKKHKIYVLFDASHMIQLIRCAFGEKQILKCANHRQIKWHYIKLLNDLLEKKGLYFGNKRKQKRLLFFKQNVKVKTELLNDSVADAIEYCLKTLELEEFAESEETIKFIRIINKCFDILNSRTVVAPFFKKAIGNQNVISTSKFISEAISYIQNIDYGNRKMGFHSLIINLRNVLYLFNDYVKNGLLEYLPMYRLGQDPLELFFASVRSKLRYNDNPTARQFQTMYRKLLIRTELGTRKIGTYDGPLDQILTVNDSPVEKINNTTPKHLLLHDFYRYDEENLPELLECSKNIAINIAGFIAYSLKNKMKCGVCISAILDDKINFDSSLIIITQKLRREFSYPTKDVVKIVLVCERLLRTVKIYNRKNILQYFNSKVLANFIGTNLFENLYQHMFDTTSQEGNHFILLIKSICEEYLEARAFERYTFPFLVEENIK